LVESPLTTADTMLDTNTDTCTFGAASLGFWIAVVGPEGLESNDWVASSTEVRTPKTECMKMTQWRTRLAILNASLALEMICIKNVEARTKKRQILRAIVSLDSEHCTHTIAPQNKPASAPIHPPRVHRPRIERTKKKTRYIRSLRIEIRGLTLKKSVKFLGSRTCEGMHCGLRRTRTKESLKEIPFLRGPLSTLGCHWFARKFKPQVGRDGGDCTFTWRCLEDVYTDSLGYKEFTIVARIILFQKIDDWSVCTNGTVSNSRTSDLCAGSPISSEGNMSQSLDNESIVSYNIGRQGSNSGEVSTTLILRFG